MSGRWRIFAKRPPNFWWLSERHPRSLKCDASRITCGRPVWSTCSISIAPNTAKQDPRERRQLKFEVEAWQLHLRDLEDRGQDILTSTPELERIGTKEELADWFRKNEIGRYRLLGR
jgi:hypothetical protein